jgi:DME family drug/metabolite transporter
VLWGTVGVANSLTTELSTIDPAVAGMTRTALGAASLLITAEMLGIPRVHWRRLPLRLLTTFGLAGAVFQTCLFAAFDAVGVTVTVAVTVCAPVVLVVAGEAAWWRRWPEAGVSVAIGIAVLGVALAMAGEAAPTGFGRDVDWRGVALLSAASAAYAVVAGVARVMARDLHPLRATGLGLGVTAGALALVVVLSPGAGLAPLGALPAKDLATLGYTGIAATGGAYLAFVLGLHLSRSAASGLAATLIEPGVAAVLAAALLHERLARPEGLGCALMLAAMVMLYFGERRAEARGTTNLLRPEVADRLTD